jgi:hypothetical protein
LQERKLAGADLSGANLENAKVDLNNLRKEAQLSNTILPDKEKTPENPTSSSPCKSNLRFDSSQWNNYFYNTNVNKTTALANVSESNVDEPNTGSGDKALQISLLGGTQYTGFQAYRILPPNNNAHTFELCLSFYFTGVTPIQALAFSIQKWAKSVKWEWAIQWQNIGDGTPQQGTPPNWRIWTGSGMWHDTQKPQQVLSTGHWYKLDLVGKVVNGKVQYGGNSTFDSAPLNLGQDQFDPVSPKYYVVDQVVVSVELNGNSQEDPYDVYIDNINFTYN